MRDHREPSPDRRSAPSSFASSPTRPECNTAAIGKSCSGLSMMDNNASKSWISCASKYPSRSFTTAGIPAWRMASTARVPQPAKDLRKIAKSRHSIWRNVPSGFCTFFLAAWISLIFWMMKSSSRSLFSGSSPSSSSLSLALRVSLLTSKSCNSTSPPTQSSGASSTMRPGIRDSASV